MLQKYLWEVKIEGIKTFEGLFEAATKIVDCELAFVTVQGKHNL